MESENDTVSIKKPEIPVRSITGNSVCCRTNVLPPSQCMLSRLGTESGLHQLIIQKRKEKKKCLSEICNRTHVNLISGEFGQAC